MSHWVGSWTGLFAFVMMVTSQDDVVFRTLDLAEQAFDDQYLGCKRNMERKLEEENVLNIEIEQNKKLKRAWTEAKQAWVTRKNDLKVKLPEGFKDEHGIALKTYTSFIRKDFNNAVRSAGKSYQSYMDDFGFKWLHFYVTSALQLLSQSKFPKYTIYSGTDHNIEVPPNGTVYVKFGHFLYTSLEEEEATVMGNTSLLIIDNYPGVSIEDFSEYPGEREVLVPGYEVFSLSPMEEDGRFKLKATGKFCSNFNCAYIKGERSKLSVQECMNAAASFRRMQDPVLSGLITVLLVVVVTFL